MRKPPIKRIAADTCAVTIEGETYYPHEGEWVELYTGRTVGEERSAAKMAILASQFSATDDPQEIAGIGEEINACYDDLSALLCSRLVAWSWTDDRDNPLPQPDGTPAVLQYLRAEEIGWLLAASGGEVAAERKNGFRPLPTTSSATESTPGRSSTTGRSRTKG